MALDYGHSITGDCWSESFAKRALLLFFFLFRQRLGKQPRQFSMFHDHRWIALNGGEVLLLECIAAFGRSKHLARQIESCFSIGGTDGSFASESFIDTHDEFRNVMQPTELRIIHHQAEQLARVYHAVFEFVIAELHFTQSFMQPQDHLSER